MELILSLIGKSCLPELPEFIRVSGAIASPGLRTGPIGENFSFTPPLWPGRSRLTVGIGNRLKPFPVLLAAL
jgi:hypothetical protein